MAVASILGKGALYFNARNFLKWLQCVGRDDLRNKVITCAKYMYVCSRHFNNTSLTGSYTIENEFLSLHPLITTILAFKLPHTPANDLEIINGHQNRTRGTICVI